MLRDIFKRLLTAVPVLLCVITLAFLLTRFVPGGPFDDERNMSQDVRDAIDETYGLGKPLWQQYCMYVANVSRFEFGPSMKYAGWEVSELLEDKISVSFGLACYSIGVAIVFGLIFGVLSAKFNKCILGSVFSLISILGICLPTFVLGPLMSYFFGYKLRLVPVVGWNAFASKILPSLSLGLFYGAYIAKLLHASILDVMSKEYVVFARSKGLSEWRIFFVHILRNAMGPVIAYLGPTFAGMISGSFVIETVFHIPGVGRLFIDAINNRDSTLIMGIVIFYAATIFLFNIITDIVSLFLFQRQRRAR